MNENKFQFSEIEDVRIIIKIKGKHFGIIPKKDQEEFAKEIRKEIAAEILQFHDVVYPCFEEIRDMKIDKV